MAKPESVEIWNPGTQRYECFGFDRTSKFDRERLKEACQEAERRGGSRGAFGGQRPYLNGKPYEQ